MLQGCYTALITPFTSDGEVDYETLRRLVEFQVAQGVSGILAVGTTGESATLSWTTASEQNNAGFRVQHKAPSQDSWSRIGFVESKATGGTTTDATTYQFSAEDLSVGAHQFRLKQVDLEGTTHLHASVELELTMKQALRVSGPAPNPVRNQATVSFAVKERKEVTLTLYNLLGQKVRTLYRDVPAPGQAQRTPLDASTLSSGTYFLRLQADGKTKTRRVTVVQ